MNSPAVPALEREREREREREKQEDQEFKSSLGYIVSLRLSWATGGSVSKTKANK